MLDVWFSKAEYLISQLGESDGNQLFYTFTYYIKLWLWFVDYLVRGAENSNDNLERFLAIVRLVVLLLQTVIVFILGNSLVCAMVAPPEDLSSTNWKLSSGKDSSDTAEKALLDGKDHAQGKKSWKIHPQNLGLRGFWAFFFYYLIHDSAQFGMSQTFGAGPYAQFYYFIMINIGLSSMHTTWIYQILTKEKRSVSTKRARDNTALLLGPIYLNAFARGLATVLVVRSIQWSVEVWNKEVPLFETDRAEYEDVLLLILCMAMPFICAGLGAMLILPANTVLVRVQAALLPESVATLRPVDRRYLAETMAGAENLSDFRKSLSLAGWAWGSLTRRTCWEIFGTFYFTIVIAACVIFPMYFQDGPTSAWTAKIPY